VGGLAAWVAFLLTIPFMSTLLPYALGIGLLMRGTNPRARSTGTDPVGAPAVTV
jgi:hypothetical protein